MKPANYLLLMFIPALIAGGYVLGGWWNFLVPVCCFVVYPVTNLFLSSKKEASDKHKIYSTSSYSIVALSFVPVLLVVTGWAIYVAGNSSLSGVAFAGLALSVGVVNGVLGFTLAHEFIHRFSKTEKAAGYLLLLLNNYMHYGIEHVWGHHVYACTPDDPHTARLGEPLYFYLLRAIRLTYTNAWEIDAKKMVRTAGRFTFIRSRMILFSVMQILLMLGIFFTCGIFSLIFFFSSKYYCHRIAAHYKLPATLWPGKEKKF